MPGAEPPDLLVCELGMVRSGTSAVALTFVALGLQPAGCGSADLVEADANNPRGYVESKTLNELQGELLRAVGGTRHAPPRLVPDWLDEPALLTLRDRAAELANRCFPAGPVLWKDRSNNFLLPFWASLLDRKIVNVLVYRHPADVLASCQSWNQWDDALVLASWERHYRSALATLDGKPVLCVRFEDVLDAPSAFVSQACRFLERHGVATRAHAADRAQLAIEPSLANSRRPPGTDRDSLAEHLLPSQLDLVRKLDNLRGAHDRFSPNEDQCSSMWVDAILARQNLLDARVGHLSFPLPTR